MDKNLLNELKKDIDSLSEKQREDILLRLRSEVDKLDEEIIELLEKRNLYSISIGKLKRSLNLSTYTPEREKFIFGKIDGLIKNELTSVPIKKIYERILDESRTLQNKNFDIVTDQYFNKSSKINLKKIFSIKEIIVIIFFFAAVLFFLYYTFFTPNYYDMKAPVLFEVRRGETLNSILDRLYDQKIIPNKSNLKIAAFIYGAEKKIRAARYYIPNGLSYFDLLDMFISGDADFLKTVRVFEGSSLNWVASGIKNELKVDSAEFIRACSDRNLLDSLGIKASNLEGYILPQRYYAYERSSPNEVVKLLFTGFRDLFTDSLKKQADILGYSVHNIITLASIIEGETNNKTEMKRISGVYHNRLKRGMKLQADPTIQFLQKNGWKRLTYKDLNTDSPYNTYKYAGLPPGPINNPGRDAIFAALFPEKNEYFFFVADTNGTHRFSKTFSEHVRLAEEYRKWLNFQKK